MIGDFSAKIFSRGDFLAPKVYTGLTLIPSTWSASTYGGPKSATIQVEGNRDDLLALLDSLYRGVEIYNRHGETIWQGMVWSCDIDLGSTSYEVSMDDVANYITVAYVTMGSDGKITDSEYGPVQDTLSQSIYGLRQLRLNLSDQMSEAEAILRANRELDARKLPSANRQNISSGIAVASLNCVGLFQELDSKYHQSSGVGGRTEYEPGGEVVHPLGVRLEDSTATLSDNKAANGEGTYNSMTGTLPPGPPNTEFMCYHGSGDSTKFQILERWQENVDSSIASDPNTYEECGGSYHLWTVGVGWKFDKGGQYLVEEGTSALGALNLGQHIRIEIDTSSQAPGDCDLPDSYYEYGSQERFYSYVPDWQPEGWYFVGSTGSERVHVNSGTDAAEANLIILADTGNVDDHPHLLAGRMTSAACLKITPTPVEEPRNTATTYVCSIVGDKVRQRVKIPTGGGGNLWKVAVPLAYSGNTQPTDNIEVHIWSDNAGSPSALIDEGTVDKTDIGTDIAMVWCELDGAGTVAVADGDWIWISVDRTEAGAYGSDPYWIVGIVEGPDPEDPEAENELYEVDGTTYDIDLYDGETLSDDTGTWAARTAREASLPYRVWTGEDLNTAIGNIIDSHNYRLSAVDALNEANVLTGFYHEGDRKASDIVRSIVDIGTSTYKPILIDVDFDGRVRITNQPSPTDTRIIALAEDGQPVSVGGGPLTDGRLYYGVWADDYNIPITQPATINDLSPVFITGMSYSTSSGYRIDTTTAAGMMRNA